MINWLKGMSASSGSVIFIFYTMTFLVCFFRVVWILILWGFFLFCFFPVQMLRTGRLTHARRPVWRMTSWLENHQKNVSKPQIIPRHDLFLNP